jgi:hypothetical protein
VVVGITFPVIYRAFFKSKIVSRLDRSLKFVVYGFAVFFFVSSFKSQPQAQWLAAILIPLCILTFPVFIQDSASRKWLYRLGFAQLAIILLARIILASPSLSPVVLEPHLAKTWVPQLKAQTHGEPLVFVNSYQNASVYRFYTGIDTHSFGIPRGRKSQYSLLGTESLLQGKTVYGVGKQLTDQPFLVIKAGDSLHGYRINTFESFQGLQCLIDGDGLEFSPGERAQVSFTLINPYKRAVSFENTAFFGIFQGAKKFVLAEVPLNLSNTEPLGPGQERLMEAAFIVPEIEAVEKITFRIGVSFQNLPPGVQGNRVLVDYRSGIHSVQTEY